MAGSGYEASTARQSGRKQSAIERDALGTQAEELNWDQIEALNLDIGNYVERTYATTAAYDNSIIIAGYAAFFALWAGLSSDLPSFTRLISAAFMAPSLILYIGWQIVVMITRQNFDSGRAAVLDPDLTLEEMHKEWRKLERRSGVAMAKLARFNPYVLWPSIGFGLVGGVVLGWNAAAASLGLPVLTGHW